MTPPELQRIRGRHVGYVFQDPGASLNPVMRIGTQIRESLTRHRPQFADEAIGLSGIQRQGNLIDDPVSAEVDAEISDLEQWHGRGRRWKEFHEGSPSESRFGW